MYPHVITFPKDFYFKYLKTVNGIEFTPREIDIIACIFNMRKRSKIASLLSISLKTVENHSSKIRQKLKCNSSEGIIDFIVKSGKSFLIRKYYQEILIRVEFENVLKKIALQLQKQKPVCYFAYENPSQEKLLFVKKIEKHLNILGIKLINEQANSTFNFLDYIQNNPLKIILYITSQEFLETLDSRIRFDNCSFLLLNENSPSLTGEVTDNLGKYYFSFFEILKILSPSVPIDNFISDFKKQYEQLLWEPDQKLTQQLMTPQKLSSRKNILNRVKSLIKNKKLKLLAIIFLLTSLIGVIFLNSKTVKNATSIRSDLIIPAKASLLKRPQLMLQIEKALSSQEDIKTVAIIGIGGAGKTTLARQYARSQQASVVWEINAETHESLKRSFENLAYALAKTDEEKKLFKDLQEIKDPQEKEEKILLFAQEKLRTYPDWLLVFDNVEKFTDIQKNFPHDSNVWGEGKILITTRDSNIGTNSNITSTIEIGELNPEEKLNLFSQILDAKKITQFMKTRNEKIQDFLHNIPSFPLDVSIAACYIKATGISHEDYFKSLNFYTPDFSSIQETILKESTNYKKTRNNIITLSLQHLIEADPDFQNLLLFICLLDTQNIPRELLEAYKNNLVVDNFIYHLKKHSLITEESHNQSISTFSIHRITQQIGLAYLIRKLSLKENSELIKENFNTLENYATIVTEKENYPKMLLLMGHCKKFLDQSYLFSSDITASLHGLLGVMYYRFGNYTKAVENLTLSLEGLNKVSNPSTLAHNLVYLGNALRALGDYKKAQHLLEKSLHIYKKYSPKNHYKIAETQVYLSNAYRDLGDYQTAKSLIQQSNILYKKHFPKNHHKIAEAQIYLGVLNNLLRNYEGALIAFEQGFSIYKQNFPENHFRVAWAITHLGYLHGILGNHQKAKEFLEKGIDILKKNYKHHIDYPVSLSQLGDLHRRLGNYTTAKKILEKSFVMFKEKYTDSHVRVAENLIRMGDFYKDLKNYKNALHFYNKAIESYAKNIDDHPEIAWILISIGEINVQEHRLETAEISFSKALKIFQTHRPAEAYIALEKLADVYMQKFLHASHNKDIKKAQIFKKQIIHYLTNALKIIKIYFPEDSVHLVRIQNQLKKI